MGQYGSFPHHSRGSARKPNSLTSDGSEWRSWERSTSGIRHPIHPVSLGLGKLVFFSIQLYIDLLQLQFNVSGSTILMLLVALFKCIWQLHLNVSGSSNIMSSVLQYQYLYSISNQDCMWRFVHNEAWNCYISTGSIMLHSRMLRMSLHFTLHQRIKAGIVHRHVWCSYGLYTVQPGLSLVPVCSSFDFSSYCCDNIIMISQTIHSLAVHRHVWCSY